MDQCPLENQETPAEDGVRHASASAGSSLGGGDIDSAAATAQQQRAAPKMVTIRHTRWRLLPEQGEAAAKGAFRLKVYTTCNRNGVLTVDFGKLPLSPEGSVTLITLDRELWPDGGCYALSQLSVPYDLRDFILERFISEGIPMLVDYCDLEDIRNLVLECECRHGGCNVCKQLMISQVQAELVRLADQRRSHDEGNHAYRELQIRDAYRRISALLLAVTLLISVSAEIARHVNDEDSARRLSALAQPVISRLTACRDALLQVQDGFSLDRSLYDIC